MSSGAEAPERASFLQLDNNPEEAVFPAVAATEPFLFAPVSSNTSAEDLEKWVASVGWGWGARHYSDLKAKGLFILSTT